MNNIKYLYGFSCGNDEDTCKAKAYSELQERLWGYINLSNNENLLAYDFESHKPTVKENIKFYFGLQDKSYIYNDSTGLAYHPENKNLAIKHGVNELIERDVLAKAWLGLIKINQIIEERYNDEIYFKHYLIFDFNFSLTLCVKKDFFSLGSAVNGNLNLAKEKSKFESMMIMENYYFDRENVPDRHIISLNNCLDNDFKKYVENKFDSFLFLNQDECELIKNINYVEFNSLSGFFIRAFSPDFIHYKTLPDKNNFIVPLL